MFAPLAKWVSQIDHAKRIPEVVAHAVDVATSGAHQLIVHAVSADARVLYISVNGAPGVSVPLQSSDWSTPTTVPLGIALQRGNNTIAFYNDSDYAPDLDRIVVW